MKKQNKQDIINDLQSRLEYQEQKVLELRNSLINANVEMLHYCCFYHKTKSKWWYKLFSVFN